MSRRWSRVVHCHVVLGAVVVVLLVVAGAFVAVVAVTVVFVSVVGGTASDGIGFGDTGPGPCVGFEVEGGLFDGMVVILEGFGSEGVVVEELGAEWSFSAEAPSETVGSGTFESGSDSVWGSILDGSLECLELEESGRQVPSAASSSTYY